MFAAIASLEPVKTRVIDFQTQRESMQMRMYQNHPTSNFGESFITFAIDAPESYRLEDSAAEFVFFIDPQPTKRELGCNGYQIVANPLMPSISFPGWANQVIDCVHLTTCGDWPGRDLQDFREFLQACQSRQLSFSIVDFDWAEPLQLLNQPLAGFRTLYVVILGDAFPDLNSCAALVNTIEVSNPNIVELRFGNEIRPKAPFKALLLGEMHS